MIPQISHYIKIIPTRVISWLQQKHRNGGRFKREIVVRDNVQKQHITGYPRNTESLITCYCQAFLLKNVFVIGNATVLATDTWNHDKLSCISQLHMKVIAYDLLQ